MIKIVILITGIGLLTLFIADNSIFTSLLNSFKKQTTRLYTDKEIREDGYLAIEEAIHEVPVGCGFITLLLVLLTPIIIILKIAE